MLTRPKTHPTKAILEALEYVGFAIPPGHTFEELEADLIQQSSWLFEGREKGKDNAAATQLASPETP